MGGGGFNVSSSAARSAVRVQTGASAFIHDSEVRAGKANALHPMLDLTKKPRRESRDYPGKPPATPIAMVLDVTGSMNTIPNLVIDDAHRLMKVILDVGEITDPQICTCAVGDAAKRDQAPIQVGEFEANDELFEAHLANIFKEGGGGGGGEESYELMLSFFARQVDTDTWEKRKQKGFLFIIGDEAPYEVVRRDLAIRHLGDDPETDIPLKTIAKAVQERWEVFCLRPGGTGNFEESWIQRRWESILPHERVIKVPDWHGLLPLMAGIIPIINGVSLEKVTASLRDSGFEGKVLADVVRSLTRIAAATPHVAQSDSELEIDDVDSDAVRL